MDLEVVSNLDSVMELYVRGGQKAKLFRAQTKIYFPDNNGVLPPRESKWVPFFVEVVGYI